MFFFPAFFVHFDDVSSTLCDLNFSFLHDHVGSLAHQVSTHKIIKWSKLSSHQARRRPKHLHINKWNKLLQHSALFFYTSLLTAVVGVVTQQRFDFLFSAHYQKTSTCVRQRVHLKDPKLSDFLLSSPSMENREKNKQNWNMYQCASSSCSFSPLQTSTRLWNKSQTAKTSSHVAETFTILALKSFD